MTTAILSPTPEGLPSHSPELQDRQLTRWADCGLRACVSTVLWPAPSIGCRAVPRFCKTAPEWMLAAFATSHDVRAARRGSLGHVLELFYPLPWPRRAARAHDRVPSSWRTIVPRFPAAELVSTRAASFFARVLACCLCKAPAFHLQWHSSSVGVREWWMQSMRRFFLALSHRCFAVTGRTQLSCGWCGRS